MPFEKIARDLSSFMRSTPNGEPIPIIVRRKPDAPATFEALSHNPSVDRTFRLIQSVSFRATSAQIEALSHDSTVIYVWHDQPVNTCLDTSVPLIRAPKIWSSGYNGKGVRIAFVDTGLDPNHPDFGKRVRQGISFVIGNDSWQDDNGHGTHVAGIAAGAGVKSKGKYTGVAPAADIYVAKCLDRYGGGNMSNVMAGVEWAVEQKAQIINLSLGGSGPSDGTDALSTLCDEAVRQAGVVMCVAAGNTGPGDSTVGSPGSARYVITVGAATDQDQVASFSSRGPTSDGRVKPDLLLPGVNIISCQAGGTQIGDQADDGYVIMSGTSMASPHASGLAALILQARPKLSPAQVKQAMMAGAIDIGASPNAQGVGRVDGYNAFAASQTEDISIPTPSPTPAKPGDDKQPAQEKSGCLPLLIKLPSLFTFKPRQ